MDIFSYVSKNILTLEQLEEIFKQGINEPQGKFNGYYVQKLEQLDNLDDVFKPAIEEMNNARRNIAFVLKGSTIIAIIGYKSKQGL